MRLTLLVALALLAGCGGPVSQTAKAPASRVGVSLVPDGAGLGIAGSSQRIDFGRAPSGVIATLDRELGPHRELPATGCAPGVVRQLAWGDLVLSFAPEQFVGWRNASGAGGQTCAA